MTYITASKLYDYTQCPHRVWRDIYGPQEEKLKEENPFVQLLWEKGFLHEEKVVKTLGDFVNLKSVPYEQRFERTLEEMRKGTPLIYQGLLRYENMEGVPDLLRKKDDGTYIPIDIKSGRGFEGAEEEGELEKLKEHYAVQLGLYLELLQKLGFSKEWVGIIYDTDNKEVVYKLDQPKGVKNKKLWTEHYSDVKDTVSNLIYNKTQNKPALSGTCKLCTWYLSCKRWCAGTQDLTLLFNLGRSKRDVINSDLEVDSLEDLRNVNLAEVIKRKLADKSFLPGIGELTLKKIAKRTDVFLNVKKPLIYEPVTFPSASYELFFDIEDDPTQGLIYLHGVYERSKEATRFIYFVAENTTVEAEEAAWKGFWSYIRKFKEGEYSLYYYSHHEETMYKKLQKQYPSVVSADEVESLFNNSNSVDLYDFIASKTDWPLSSYSLKEIAVYLGFKWRDESPSGALSIQWYNHYLETKDPKDLERILKYNEDDCKASMVIKDGLVNLSKGTFSI